MSEAVLCAAILAYVPVASAVLIRSLGRGKHCGMPADLAEIRAGWLSGGKR